MAIQHFCFIFIWKFWLSKRYSKYKLLLEWWNNQTQGIIYSLFFLLRNKVKNLVHIIVFINPKFLWKTKDRTIWWISCICMILLLFLMVIKRKQVQTKTFLSLQGSICPQNMIFYVFSCKYVCKPLLKLCLNHLGMLFDIILVTAVIILQYFLKLSSILFNFHLDFLWLKGLRDFGTEGR